MNYPTFRYQMAAFSVFSLADIRTYYPSFDKRRLVEWQDKGYIQMIVRGYYRFTEQPLNEGVLFLIANKIYSPSYISLEMGLAYYGLIPEGVYKVTSVASSKTATFTTPIGTFVYQSIRPALLFGTRIIMVNGVSAFIGEREKVILDYFYLHPELDSREKILGMRFNADSFNSDLDMRKLDCYLQAYQNQALARRIQLLKETHYAGL